MAAPTAGRQVRGCLGRWTSASIAFLDLKSHLRRRVTGPLRAEMMVFLMSDFNVSLWIHLIRTVSNTYDKELRA